MKIVRHSSLADLLQHYSLLVRVSSGGAEVNHVVDMCRQMQSFEDREKLMRWLGFVQGYLWTKGLRTIDDMREDVRDLKESSRTSSST